MPTFTHDAEISERIIQLTLHNSFDMVHRYTSLPRHSLQPAHDIGPNGFEDVLQRGDGIVRGLELHQCTDTKLLSACKYGGAVSTRCANAQRPWVAFHRPCHQSP